MGRRAQEEHNIRKITRLGPTSYGITLPIEIIRKLKWKERQKLTVEEKNGVITIRDWKK